MKNTIAFLGAGKMAEGILGAVKEKSSVVMAEKSEERAAYMRGKYGVKVVPCAASAAKGAKYVFLAVRPQDVDEVAKAVRPVLAKGQTLVSIVAGKTLASLRKAFGAKARIIRVMPNLALRVNAGMCVLTAHDRTVEGILGAAGETCVLAEKYFDAVTALSGSGPAYFAYMLRAMSAAGAKAGLPAKTAGALALQTMFGTAKFLRESGMDLGEFIAGVCTKGGTTAAGMKKLDVASFGKAVDATIAAAADRSRELRQA